MGGNTGRANRKAAISVAVLGIYLQIVEWVDLYPWNDVRSGNGQETLDMILAGVTIGLVIWLFVGGRLAAAAAATALIAWGYLQLSTWWLSYFQGASDSWKRVYENWFSTTVQILPRSADHLPPDANHLVLQFLILIALTFSLRAIFARRN